MASLTVCRNITAVNVSNRNFAASDFVLKHCKKGRWQDSVFPSYKLDIIKRRLGKKLSYIQDDTSKLEQNIPERVKSWRGTRETLIVEYLL